ncbi:prophage tail fiber N-terminal domain-containing protein [Salmonella enterica]|uniref:Prophage tail fiber N-terminal domain-containing protein n=1 Tax=Salmonella enterica subsp. enterica serovar Newport str. WA_14882 TaxID=997339 RepID=A0AAU7YFW6_SALNE|nr:prophage tail fiber N-terminal domain-containing protein [Salmonella enterica]EDQ0051417.1 shikimate transporter [Salmonella enterica subsp. enterica]ESC45996.1 side tail fiber protein [Salmonella enterica subsp. enterica serovar Newport str. RI_10P078]ESC55359.1 side tail fiber protein [Salmonella enterica subsp. enterica serovar Newport str. RI_10P069]ESC61829.1 side tail fiber protein [Salmonella enterica subsp. enterica serovar Newport str. WA_14900]ESC76798.1 side tail fiber protein [S
MPVLISGVLKDGAGTPVQNCTIQLKACRTSTTVVVNTVASENPDDAGRYSMDVEQGQYAVTLLVEGYPPSHAGVITVYDDSKPGTLNDFLGAMTEDDVRPEALRRFEAMVEEVARQASEALRNATAAGQASEQAQTSAGQAAESATAAVNAAGAAEASATQAASSAASAESSAGTATTKAGEASASAASADTARTEAAASAAAAKTSEANADASRTAAGDSATAAAASATAAQASAERAGASETAAKTSETQAASSAGEAGASATAAAASEKVAAASAAEAKTSETNAATSASTAAGSATAASSSASAASTHAAASDTSASLAAQSSTAAGAAATRAEEAAKRAEDIADVISLEDASLTKKGIVKLSSAADSDSEVLAATPKAVKTVMGEVQTKAPLDSPAFTGTPTTPTPPDDAKGLQTANAEFVRKLIAALVGSVPESLDTLQELADALGNDPNFATTVLNKLAGKQPLDDTLTALSGKSVDGLIEYVGLRETINRAAGALQKDQNGADIPDKKQFARTIGAVTSTSVTFGESGWFKIATVFMPQATSTAVIKLYGGSGFNVGSFEQAAISELVLRAGNGSPVGITATLWRRSPAAANEIAWINTSGDSYDIYINIGRYAYGLIAQYDCTSNAGVILHTSPEFSETKPANATNGQTYTLFNSLMKPTAGDVEALSVSGGRLNGPLGIGTDNALGGNSIVFGDNDTGLKQNGDGILDIFANNQHTVRVAPGEMIVLGAIRAGNGKKLSLTSTNNSALNAGFNLWGDGGNRPTVIELGDDQGWHLYSQRNTDGSIQFVVNGQVIPDNYGNFDARYLSSGNVYTKGESDNRYVQNIQRGAPVWPGKVDEYGPNEAPAGCFLTQARHDPTTAYGVTFAYRPLQMWVGNGWRTING